MDTQRLRELFHYDPSTGTFTRRITVAGNAKAGDIAGCLRRDGYLCIVADGKLYLAHRLAWLYMTGAWPLEDIDHANMNRADNRFFNLREANRTENFANKKKSSRNTSGYKGVCWVAAHQKWMAQIKKNGKSKFLGYYDSPLVAHQAYCVAAIELFGSFARGA